MRIILHTDCNFIIFGFVIPAWENIFRSPKFKNIALANFDDYSLHSGLCLGDLTAEKRLEPGLRCNDIFSIDYDTNKKSTKLIIDKSGKEFDHYGLYVHDDLSYSAAVCRESLVDETKEQ